jgi:hypothetical protein
MTQTYAQYKKLYGDPNQRISPEMAFQEVERRRAGQEILDGQKFGSGLPAALGMNRDGSPTSGGAGGGGGLGAAFQSAADAANAANEARYGQGLDLLRKRRADAKGLFERTSGGMFRELDRTQQREIGRATSADAARGMLRSGAGMSRERVYDRNEVVSRAEGEIAQRQALLDSQLSKDEVDFIERRTDAGPDMNQLIALERQAGSGSTAGIYGGGGGMYGMGGGQQAVAPQQTQQTQQPAAPRMRDQGPSGYVSYGTRPRQPVAPAMSRLGAMPITAAPSTVSPLATNTAPVTLGFNDPSAYPEVNKFLAAAQAGQQAVARDAVRRRTYGYAKK